MNKRLSIIGLSSVALVFSVLFPAQVLAANIGFVNPVRLLDQAPQTKALKEKVEREFKPRDTDLVAKQKDLRKKEEKLQKDSSTMSATQQQELESEIAQLRREIKRDLDEFREDFTVARNREMAKLQKRINEAIVKLAKEGNYDLIVGDSVIYASEKIDVTDKVLKILQEDFKKNAGK